MGDISAAKAGKITFGGITVNRMGLGTNRIHDDRASHELLMRAVGHGINFIDTAHVYAGGQSEVAIGNTLAPYKDGLIIATKGGMGNGATPAQLRSELQESLRRLKTDRIDLYQLHRVDPSTPLAETMQALRQFRDEGLINAIGLSEVGVEQIAEAAAIVPIASVQNEYNIANRQHERVVDYCTDHGIAFIPWFPLGGRGESRTVMRLVEDLAAKYDASPQQIALAWLLKRSPMMLPIPGTTSPGHLEDNLKAGEINLSAADFQSVG